METEESLWQGKTVNLNFANLIIGVYVKCEKDFTYEAFNKRLQKQLALELFY